jgi:DNA-binding transcriptional ArsR family regulator
MDKDICQTTFIDEKRIALAKEQMPDEANLLEMANIFKLLGDVTRMRIIRGLAATELCVCEIAELLKMTSSAISHQLRLLRAHNIVHYRKEGKIVYYSLNEKQLRLLVDNALQHGVTG